MALYPTFAPGYDPTADATAITRSNLNKILNEGEFVDFVGPIIHSASAPNVALYPKLGYFIWHELNVDLTPTRKLYVHNGTDWVATVPADGSISGDQIVDGSIGLEKLDADGLTTLYILRVSAPDGSGNLSIEAVSLDTIIPAGSLAVTKLVPAAAADYIMVSAGGGTWTAANFLTYLQTFLAANKAIPHTGIYDGDNTGSLYQVLGRSAGANAGVTWAYIETLLRANQTPTTKLQFPAALWGKRVRVKADGSDFEAEDINANAVKVGMLKYTGVTNTAAQTVPADTATLVQWNNETDPDNAISGISSHIITLETGTYEIEVTVPMQSTVAAEIRIGLFWEKVDGGVIQATQTMALDDDDDRSIMILRHVFDVTEITEEFRVLIYATEDIVLGAPLNVGTYVETYQTAVIRKLA